MMLKTSATTSAQARGSAEILSDAELETEAIVTQTTLLGAEELARAAGAAVRLMWEAWPELDGSMTDEATDIVMQRAV